MTDQVKVFDLDGNEHLMTVANAADMCRHRGWKRQEEPKRSEESPEAGARPSAPIFVVYDPQGNRHEMDHLNAQDMVAHAGWRRGWTNTQTGVANDPPNSVAPVGPTATAPETPVADEAPPVTTEIPVDLTQMSREGLLRVAKEHFDMTFDANVANEQIIDAILQEQTAP